MDNLLSPLETSLLLFVVQMFLHIE